MERKLIAAAVSSALALPMAAQAIEFSASGHVNRAVISVDGQDNDDDLQHVDSNASQSRVRFTGSEDIGDGLTAGVNMELGVLSTGSSSGTTTRHAALNLSGEFGKLTLGHTSAAADGMAHARLGGASWLAGVTNWCSYVSNGPACPSNDGGRIDVLRYDTPALGPAKVAVSTGDNEYWDAKLSIAGSSGDIGYDFRIGHIAKYNDDAAGDVTTTSAAVSFGQGTSIAVAWSQDGKPGNAAQEHEYTYVEADHSYGDGSIGVYWKQGELTDSMMGNKEGSLWGIGMGHSIGGGVTAYAGYRNVEEDNEEDVSLIVAGMRVTFN